MAEISQQSISPEKYRNLWASVLTQAISDITAKKVEVKNKHSDDRSVEVERERRSAIAWVSSRRVDEQSFVWVCDILNIDSDRARIKIFENVKTLAAA